jgi:hypothetical protein
MLGTTRSTLRFHYLPALLAALTAIGSVLALAGAAIGQRWLPAAFWHLVFAVGALPMILTAMAYFTPVLTRTPEAPRGLALLPLVALLAGLAIVAWFVHGVAPLRQVAHWLALGAVAGLALWMRRRWRACLGPPHACLSWYAAALFCLGLGLAAVGASALRPELGPYLRTFHLHINMLGFMGLTAIGTLQVLLPTVLGRPDPATPRRLARDLSWSLAGALGIAAGASVGGPLGGIVATVATAAYAWPLLHLAHDIRRAFGGQVWSPRQATPLLLAAMTGLMLTLIHGLAHGMGLIHARDVLPMFVIGFLLPLVSGAVSQLLPVWLRPGAQAEWHRQQRTRLAAFARTRAVLLVGAGVLSAVANETVSTTGHLLGILGALWLIGAMALTVRRAISQPR